MNNALLKQFYENKPLREAVRWFFSESLKELAAEMAFAGEDTSGIKEANLSVDKSFDKLQEIYGKIPTSIIPNSR